MTATDTIELNEKRDSYPRVSDILGKQNANAMRSIPVERLVEASLRGSAVHRYCTTFLEKLFMPEIEEQYLKYVESFIQWANANVDKVLFTSRRLYDDELKFSGEFDAIVILKDSEIPTLIDIKVTCLPSKTWPLQLAAYHHLCLKNNIQVGRIMNVHLKKSVKTRTEEKEGKKVKVSYPLVVANQIQHLNISASWGLFSSALACYDYFDRKEQKEASDVCV
jgi:hypothetical protein